MRLDDPQLSALCSLGNRRTYAQDELLFQEGDRSDHVVVILRGTVKIFTTAKSGYETVLALRSAGDILGEFSAFDQHPRSASVVALSAVTSALIQGSRFRAYLRAEPDLALAILSGLVHRLRESDRRRMEFGSLDVTGRVSRILLEFADRPGQSTTTRSPTPADANTITVSLSQAELAGVIGASREAVARSLRALRDHEAIATRRLRITILRPDILRNLSNGQLFKRSSHQHTS